jgi:hypothetical protein
MQLRTSLLVVVILPTLPFMMGAAGDGCAVDSTTPAPDVSGTWQIAYDDAITVEATIGGIAYAAQLGGSGGAFTITAGGVPYTFDLDCSRPDVMCPSRAWPNQVVITQTDPTHDHQMTVDLPQAQCQGSLVQPSAASCGSATDNPNCDLVCDGDIDIASADAPGVIGDAGDSFRLYLGGGIVTNGVNCALLGYSVADADLTTAKAGSAWTASAMTDGTVTLGYSGTCLWAGTAPDGNTQAVLANAALKLTTGFTGDKE